MYVLVYAYVSVSMSVWVHVYVCGYPWKPVGLDTLGARVTDSCNLPDMGPGN